MKTSDHFGMNFSSVGKFIKDLYGLSFEVANLTRSAGILVQLMAGKKLNFEKNEVLRFNGISSKQVARSIMYLLKAGFHGKVNLN